VGCDRVGDDRLMAADLDAMVDAYWRYHQLFHGTRQERLARDAYFWAWDAVETAVMESPIEAIEMIDAVLRHPDADPVYVGAGPIENLLSGHPPPLVLEEVALRCRQDRLWREAVSGAYVDDPVPASIAPFVAQPRPASAPSREVPSTTTSRRKPRRPRPAGKPRRLPGK
jgi:hypothetical protein